MKDRIFKNWNTWRVIRYLLSLVFVISGAMEADYFLLAGGIFIMYQAVFNTGCCSSRSCEVKYQTIKVKNK